MKTNIVDSKNPQSQGDIMKHKETVSIVAIILLLVLGYSDASAVGETGAQFLKIGIGAKACAMGEAFAGLSDDPSAIYWNPAGMMQMKSLEILMAQNYWLMDMSDQYLSAVIPSSYGAFGASINYSSSGDIPKYENEQRIGDYSAYDAALSVAYANNLNSQLIVGVGFKYIQQRIEDESAAGFSVDIGLIYELNFIKNLRMGCVMQNLGPGIKFIKEADPLPFNFKGGAAYKINDLTLVGDINFPKDSDFQTNLGVEYILRNLLALRMGFNTANSYTAGVGILWRKFEIDYAFVPYKDVDNSTRISVRIKF